MRIGAARVEFTARPARPTGPDEDGVYQFVTRVARALPPARGDQLAHCHGVGTHALILAGGGWPESPGGPASSRASPTRRRPPRGRCWTPDILVGTSAGSAVAAQIPAEACRCGCSHERQVAEDSPRTLSGVDIEALMRLFLDAVSQPDATARQKLQRIGVIAASSPPPCRAGAQADDRAPVAVATGPTGTCGSPPSTSTPVNWWCSRVVWGGAGRRVAASCTVPGTRPPVTIGDQRYMDGGWPAPAHRWRPTATRRWCWRMPAGEFAPSPFSAGVAAGSRGVRVAPRGVRRRGLSAGVSGPTIDPRCRVPSGAQPDAHRAAGRGGRGPEFLG